MLMNVSVNELFFICWTDPKPTEQPEDVHFLSNTSISSMYDINWTSLISGHVQKLDPVDINWLTAVGERTDLVGAVVLVTG